MKNFFVATIAFFTSVTSFASEHIAKSAIERLKANQSYQVINSQLPTYISWFGIQPTITDHCGAIRRSLNIHFGLYNVSDYPGVRVIDPNGLEILNNQTSPDNWSIGHVPESIYIYGGSNSLTQVVAGTYTIELRSVQGQVSFIQISITNDELLRSVPVINYPSCGATLNAGLTRSSWDRFNSSLPSNDHHHSIFTYANGEFHFDQSANMTGLYFNAVPGANYTGVMYEAWRTINQGVWVISSSERVNSFNVN